MGHGNDNSGTDVALVVFWFLYFCGSVIAAYYVMLLCAMRRERREEREKRSKQLE